MNATTPVQITFRHLPHSEAIEALVREKADKLGLFYPRVMGCRVAVEASHHQSVRATLYHVRVDVTVPGGEVVAGSEAMPHGSTDLATAVRDAFDAAGRRLQDHGKRRRGEVKLHEAPQPHGKVARFFPQQGYGFLTTEDGREVYFHEHAVLDGGFRRLSVGADVRFLEEEGQDGPQATTVVLVGH